MFCSTSPVNCFRVWFGRRSMCSEDPHNPNTNRILRVVIRSKPIPSQVAPGFRCRTAQPHGWPLFHEYSRSKFLYSTYESDVAVNSASARNSRQSEAGGPGWGSRYGRPGSRWSLRRESEAILSEAGFLHPIPRTKSQIPSGAQSRVGNAKPNRETRQRSKQTFLPSSLSNFSLHIAEIADKSSNAVLSFAFSLPWSHLIRQMHPLWPVEARFR